MAAYQDQMKKKENIAWWELVVLGLILLACLLVFRQQDIAHTAVSSVSLLKGHILDFYSYNESVGIPDSYLPSTYLVYAIWCIPPFLLGQLDTIDLNLSTGLYFYMEMLPVLVYLASGVLVYRIAHVVGADRRQSRIIAYVTLTLPVALYSQFIFCQYDIFTIFFMLLGIDAYFRDRKFRFILFFGIAATFKYFSVAVFVPLLLLREKNWFKIIGSSLLMGALFGLEVLVYIKDASFVHYVLNFSALNYLISAFGFTGTAAAVTDVSVAGTVGTAAALTCTSFASALLSGAKTILEKLEDLHIQLVIAAIICLWAYFVKPKDKIDLFNWMNFLCSCMMYAIFGFMFWHPQWLLLCMPFWGMSVCFSKKPVPVMLLDAAFMVLFVAYVSNKWFRELDQGLMELGILKNLVAGQTGAQFMIKDFYLYSNVSVMKFGLACMMLLIALVRYPRLMVNRVEQISDHLLPAARVRWGLGLGSFLVPCAICLYLAVTAPYCTFNGEDLSGHLPGITKASWLSQVFVVETDEASYLEFYVYDYDRTNTGTLAVTITDLDTGEVMTETDYDVSTFPNRGWVRMDLADAGLKAGARYLLDFNSQDATMDNSVTLYHTSELSEDPRYYGLYDGQPLGSNLCIKIFENARAQ